jgi:cyclic-di-AMP phosphodiesterase PgpH
LDSAPEIGYNWALVRTKKQCLKNSSGSGLALAAIAVAAVLFVRSPVSFAAEAAEGWFLAKHLGAALAVGVAALSFWVFWQHFGLVRPPGERRLRNVLFLIFLQAVCLRVAVEFAPGLHQLGWSWCPTDAWLWTPWFLTTGLAAMLLGSRLGAMVAVGSVFLLYLRADPGPLPLTACLVSSLYGIYLLRRPTRARALRAGAAAGGLLGAIALLQSLPASSVWALAAAGLVPILIGLVSAFLVLAALPVLEWTLGELSDVTLVEYASDHPLLDRLKEEAPGTWHHSLNVADLAEKAATAIGARARFCRAAALYHDIGKMKNPFIFAENITGPSPHDDLDPQVSARLIIKHVSDGLELAREHGLPKAFQEIIAEHHGISVVRFFYGKACAQLREGEDPETLRPLFSYGGPPPSSRESGIISLADVVEAATRSLTTSSEKQARDYVRKLIADRISEGELAHCPLTLAELAEVENTFVPWVHARGHRRPSYPKTSTQLAGDSPELGPTQSAAQRV